LQNQYARKILGENRLKEAI